MKWVFVAAFNNINIDNNRVLAIMNHVEGEKTVFTADFYHGKKRYYYDEEKTGNLQKLLHVPAYKKNLSIKRIWSHIVFARQLKQSLKSLPEKPDVIYCAMPTSTSAFVCAKYCKKNDVKFIIDVIDLWPDSLLPLIKGKSLVKALLFPWSFLTRYAYRSADVIIGESEAYANEAKRFNKNANVYSLYLGVDVKYIENVKRDNPVVLCKSKNEIWICYAGSLGVSYDFVALLEAVKSIHGKYSYKLWFIGDGVKRAEIENYIKEYGLNAEVTGFLPYNELLGYLFYCDIAVNIFRDNTKVVYSYKFNDYVAMHCFVLNSLEGETANMIEKYKVGRNFDFKEQTLTEVLTDTLAKWSFYSSWCDNATCLIDEKLDKEKIYKTVMESACKELLD